MHLQAIIACLKADMHQGAVAEQNLKQIQRIRSTIRAFPRLSFSLESHTSNTFVRNIVFMCLIVSDRIRVANKKSRGYVLSIGTEKKRGKGNNGGKKEKP